MGALAPPAQGTQPSGASQARDASASSGTAPAVYAHAVPPSRRSKHGAALSLWVSTALLAAGTVMGSEGCGRGDQATTGSRLPQATSGSGGTSGASSGGSGAPGGGGGEAGTPGGSAGATAGSAGFGGTGAAGGAMAGAGAAGGAGQPAGTGGTASGASGAGQGDAAGVGGAANAGSAGSGGQGGSEVCLEPQFLPCTADCQCCIEGRCGNVGLFGCGPTALCGEVTCAFADECCAGGTCPSALTRSNTYYCETPCSGPMGQAGQAPMFHPDPSYWGW